MFNSVRDCGLHNYRQSNKNHEKAPGNRLKVFFCTFIICCKKSYQKESPNLPTLQCNSSFFDVSLEISRRLTQDTPMLY